VLLEKNKRRREAEKKRRREEFKAIKNREQPCFSFRKILTVFNLF